MDSGEQGAEALWSRRYTLLATFLPKHKMLAAALDGTEVPSPDLDTFAGHAKQGGGALKKTTFESAAPRRVIPLNSAR